MGKKKVITKVEEIKPETPSKTSSQVKKSSKRQLLNAIARVNVSYNNTAVTINDPQGEMVAWSSAGRLGFKGTKKSTPYAANLVARDCLERARRFNLNSIKIIVKGVGPGRDSAIRGLAGSGLNIISIIDATPIAHNGVRRKKPRRV